MISRDALDWLKALREEHSRARWAAEKGKDGPIHKLLSETAERSETAYRLALGIMAEGLLDTAEEALTAAARTQEGGER